MKYLSPKALMVLLLAMAVSLSPNVHANTQNKNSDNAAQSLPPNPHDPDNPTLLEANTPDDSEISIANLELLAKNTELERQIDTLTTQNNVLVQERSGQLFLYGAMTAIFSLLLGFVAANLINPRKDRW